jgi:hypothetical protein
MARPQFPTKRKVVSLPVPATEPILLVEARINGGENTYIDPLDIPTSHLQEAKNLRIKGDKIYKRPGVDYITPIKPRSEPIILYTNFTSFDDTTYFFRFDTTKIYRKGSSDWVEITGTDYNVDKDTKVRFTAVDNRFFFAPANESIMEIDFEGDTYSKLGNAPAYKYIWTFNDRLMGANLYSDTNPHPALIGWSGNRNYDEWDPLTDISAGSVPLIESQTDFADPITGGFGFASVALILRERSLWMVQTLPIASSPYSFQVAFPSIGCDIPASATQKRFGIVWYDYRTNQVYDYNIGQSPRPIGDPIKNLLRQTIQDKNLVQGAYDAINDRYHLLVRSPVSNIATVFVYNYETESWTHDEIRNICRVFSLNGGNLPLMISDLVGMRGDLMGMISDLVIDEQAEPNIYYGCRGGDLYEESILFDDDFSGAFESVIVSKKFSIPSDVIINKLTWKVNCTREGTILLEYSKNNLNWVMLRNVHLTEGNHIITALKQITASEFVWRLTIQDGSFEILESRVEGFTTTISTKRK